MGETYAWLFYYLLGFATILGMLVGSFLNVVIYRVPAGLSIVSPPSRCPTCETPIKWYDNIPVFSWLFLGGKCRSCKTPISPRYAMVELLVGVLAGILWWQVGQGMMTIPITHDIDLVQYGVVFGFRFVLICLLVSITFVDLDHFIIPHSFTVPGMLLGLASPWVMQAMFGFPDYLRMWPPVTPVASIVGFFGGAFVILGVFYLYLAARGIEGLGGGDLTMMAMLGAWFGPAGVVFILFAASLQGIIIAVATMALGIDFVADSAEIFADEDAEEAQTPEADEHGEDTQGEEAVDAEVDSAPAETVEVGDDSDDSDDSDDETTGRLAVPFGPFIALAALEYLLLGPYMPESLSMISFNLFF